MIENATGESHIYYIHKMHKFKYSNRLACGGSNARYQPPYMVIDSGRHYRHRRPFENVN